MVNLHLHAFKYFKSVGFGARLFKLPMSYASCRPVSGALFQRFYPGKPMNKNLLSILLVCCLTNSSSYAFADHMPLFSWIGGGNEDHKFCIADLDGIPTDLFQGTPMNGRMVAPLWIGDHGDETEVVEAFLKSRDLIHSRDVMFRLPILQKDTDPNDGLPPSICPEVDDSVDLSLPAINDLISDSYSVRTAKAELFFNELTRTQRSLDYIFMDVELGRHERVMGELNDDVDFTLDFLNSSSFLSEIPNPLTSNTHIGVYNWFPWPCRDYTESCDPVNPGSALKASYSPYYEADSRINMALPELYQTVFYVNHFAHFNVDDPGFSTKSPTIRSALFWAPLERLSQVKKELIDKFPGDRLVPFVSTHLIERKWICSEENITTFPNCINESDLPTLADYQALVIHARLRGADSFYFFPGVDDKLPGDPVSQAVLFGQAWKVLDPYFTNQSTLSILNLDTNKPEGAEWSAIRTLHETLLILSNLGTQQLVFDPSAKLDISGVDPILIPAGEHSVCKLRQNFIDCQSLPLSPGDFNRDGRIDTVDIDLLSSAVYA